MTHSMGMQNASVRGVCYVPPIYAFGGPPVATAENKNAPFAWL